MPLSDHEQHMLDQIESELSTEDPKTKCEQITLHLLRVSLTDASVFST
jgi:hypothetical protein